MIEVLTELRNVKAGHNTVCCELPVFSLGLGVMKAGLTKF
jgi:hypothetical protein